MHKINAERLYRCDAMQCDTVKFSKSTCLHINDKQHWCDDIVCTKDNAMHFKNTNTKSMKREEMLLCFATMMLSTWVLRFRKTRYMPSFTFHIFQMHLFNWIHLRLRESNREFKAKSSYVKLTTINQAKKTNQSRQFMP